MYVNLLQMISHGFVILFFLAKIMEHRVSLTGIFHGTDECQFVISIV